MNQRVERNLNFNHHFNCGFVREFGQVDLLISKSISLFANHLLCFAFISNLIASPILHSNLRDSLFLPLCVSVHHILSHFYLSTDRNIFLFPSFVSFLNHFRLCVWIFFFFLILILNSKVIEDRKWNMHGPFT